MRIKSVRGAAFGPFRDEILELAEGMTVVHGPNESGKSSWHAAIFAALCGVRRSRGRAPKEEQEFADRHRPWTGRAWSVGAQVALDDGRTIDIEQNLVSGGTSSVVDAATKRRVQDVSTKEGCADVAALLGLDRGVVLATIFVKQADILRVMFDAEELQEYLERAAATSAVDTTADEAIDRVEIYRKDRVGVLRKGSSRPLQVATTALDSARSHADELRDQRVEYNELLVSKYRDELDLSEVLSKLKEAEAHEHERQRRQEWLDIQEAQKQLGQAKQLAAQIGAGPSGEGPAHETIAIVTRAMATYDERPAAPPEFSGQTAEELQRQLSEVPDAPKGDLEPVREITSAIEDWRGARARVAAHEETKPPTAIDSPTSSPTELRRLADELEQPVPEVDETLRADVTARRASLGVPQFGDASPPSAHNRSARSRGLLVSSLVILIAGAAIAALAQPAIGVVVAFVGVMGLLWSIRKTKVESAARAPVITSPKDLTSWQETQSDVTRLEARLAVQQEGFDQAQARRERALGRIREGQLPESAEELRRMASESEDLAAASRRFAAWTERFDQLQAEVLASREGVAKAFKARGASFDHSNVEGSYNDYVRECHERFEVAKRAGRRADLQAQLDSQRALELAQAEDSAARARAEEQMREAAILVGIDDSSLDALAKALRQWLIREQGLIDPRQGAAKAKARLDQILDGKTLEEFTAEVDELRAAFGEAPEQADREMVDRSGELEQLRRRVQVLRDQVSELTGQLGTSERSLGDLREAIEAEARAERELERLQLLDQDLAIVIELLNAAKDRVHADIAPVINRTLQPWVPVVTNGRYDDVRVDPASLEIQVHEAQGEFRPASVLSHGTAEQLFLLLRLALVKHLATTGETAPLILDDVTVQSDEERTVALLNLLHELSKERQVILFTQEREVLDWAAEHCDATRDHVTQLDVR